jgi:hypothetical protein
MLELARTSAPLVAGMIPVRVGARRMLDIAGSHGLYGAALCRRHPGMQSVVLDLPQALPIARRLAEAEGISDVVEHREGDMLAGNYPGGQDVILYSNILHHFSPEQSIGMLRHARAALDDNDGRQGGVVAIWDVERRPDNAGPELVGDASALFFRLTSDSSVFTAAEYAGWMQQAGFREVQTKRHMLQPSLVLTVGKK